jgi:hypothetical protein
LPTWAPARQGFQGCSQAINRRALALMQADAAGPEGTPPWTATYSTLLLAPGDQRTRAPLPRNAKLLNDLLAESAGQRCLPGVGRRRGGRPPSLCDTLGII